MKNNNAKNSTKNSTKNIRQAYNELENRYKMLADAHLILQRTMKLILISQKQSPPMLFYSNKTAEYYTLHELDDMRLQVRENEELNRMEISI